MEASGTSETTELAETAELAAELYLVPPARFVAIRDEVAHKARVAGRRELARQLVGLRRPTQSAWLVNILTRYERAAMGDLATLGRQLRQAQTRLDGAQLRQLSKQRQQLVAELLHMARRQALDAGVEPTERMLCEVEGTLHAALVDLAMASAVLSGRLVRPMAHNGFGPRPQLPAVAQAGAPAAADRRQVARLPVAFPPGSAGTGAPTPAPRTPAKSPPAARPAPPPAPMAPAPKAPAAKAPAAGTPQPPQPPGADEDDWVFWPVQSPPTDHGVAQPVQRVAFRPVDEDEARPSRRLRLVRTEPAAMPDRRGEAGGPEGALAAAESAHWRREQELASAEEAVQAARDELEWFEQHRMLARSEKVAAEQRLAEARSAQRASVRALVEARRALDAAEARFWPGGQQPDDEDR